MPITYGSVCSGIEAASVAWEQLGFIPAWFAEIEEFPSAVLAHHWPDVRNLGDMTKIANAVRTGDVAAPDVLVGGTPCQAFSVAGARNGLSDDRGKLTISFGELADAIDSARINNGKSASIIVWENVPGVLSSKDNAFGAFLALLCGEDCELESPGKKWSNAGYVSGPKRTIAWRILDAQYFGVAQRRKRVFVVASARDDINPEQILFEFESLRRDIAPSRSKREETADNATYGVETGCLGGQHPNAAVGVEVSPTLTEAMGQGGGHVPVVSLSNGKDVTGTILASCGDKQWLGNKEAFTGDFFVVHGTQDPIVNTELAHALGRNNGGENVLCADVGATITRGFGDRGVDADQIVNGNYAINYGLVRRLTPVECERLQGFPDNHTLIPYRGKSAEDCPDGKRYAAIGNSMAVPVMRWIGGRIIQYLNTTIQSKEITVPEPCEIIMDEKEAKDRWRTPLPVYNKLNAEFKFAGDVAASHDNHLHEIYLTKQDNALKEDWHQYFLHGIGHGYVFCNPPYSKLMPWINKAQEEARKGLGTVMLVHADLSTRWFEKAREDVTEIRIVTGRIPFIPPNAQVKKSGNSKGSMFLIWNPHQLGQCVTRYIRKEELFNEANTATVE